MKVAEAPLNVELNVNMEPQIMPMRANRRSYQVLFRDIYPYPIKAIVRELATNAADSHARAGTQDVPFKVHLPNSLEPWFSVCDYGTGLSPEKFLLYQTFFDSDKIETNNETGCIGIGSKSPFAYADSFTVENRYEGRISFYNFFLSDKGPAWVKLSDDPTEEANGLEVKFAVSEKDFGSFYDWSKRVLPWFEIKPEITGWAGYKLEEEEYVIKTKDFEIPKIATHNSNVVMGNVAYQLGSYDMPLSDMGRKLVEWGVNIRIDLGDAEITASREKLQYTDRSRELITKHIDSMLEIIKNDVQKQIADAPTVWQARTMFHDMKHSIIGSIRSLTTVKWNNEPLSDYIKIQEFITQEEFDAKKVLAERLERRRENFKRHETNTLIASSEKIFFLNDLEHGGYARMSSYLRSKVEDEGYVLTLHPSISQKFLDETGIGEVVIKSSTLPKPERQNKVSSVRVREKKASLVKFNRKSWGKILANYWDSAEVDLDEGGIYVEINHYKVKNFNKREEMDPSELNRYLKNIESLVVDDDIEIYGIRSMDIPKIQRKGNWIKLDDYIRKVLKDNEELKEKLVGKFKWNNLTSLSNTVILSVIDEKGIEPDSRLGRFFQECREAAEAAKDNKSSCYQTLSEDMGQFFDNTGNLHGLKEECKKITSQFPLLRYLEAYGHNDGFRASLMDYLKSKDIESVEGTKDDED